MQPGKCNSLSQIICEVSPDRFHSFAVWGLVSGVLAAGANVFGFVPFVTGVIQVQSQYSFINQVNASYLMSSSSPR